MHQSKIWHSKKNDCRLSRTQVNIARLIWDRYYEVSIKNLVDAIHNSEDKANLNAALRIHRVYLLSVISDLYGDIPASEAGLGYIKGISNPKYDTQEELYSWFFEELDACEKQLGTGTDRPDFVTQKCPFCN